MKTIVFAFVFIQSIAVIYAQNVYPFLELEWRSDTAQLDTTFLENAYRVTLVDAIGNRKIEEYSSDGKIQKISFYTHINGLTIVAGYDNKGRIKFLGNSLDSAGLSFGIQWHENGRPAHLAWQRKWDIIGTAVSWCSNGTERNSAYHDSLTFKTEVFHCNGQLAEIGQTSNRSNRFGSWKFFSPEGRMMATGSYKLPGSENPSTGQRIRHGVWEYYNDMGELCRRVTYVNNEVANEEKIANCDL